ncbi:MAG: hypothetical protein KDD47_08495, partial [Acidobacteria bacterium]|nr:hypothetical protein [Acidobacteriota bacterium]
KFKRAMRTLYQDLCGMSQTGRDGLGYHTFVPERDSASWSAWSWTEYAGTKSLPETWRATLFGEKKDIRRLVRGPQFQVPGPPSTTVIHL